MHSERHPKSGETLKIYLASNDVQAIEDRWLHGSQFKLVDWADRMHLDTSLSERHFQVAISFYAHRAHPALPIIDPLPVGAVDLECLVYGFVNSGHPDPRDRIVILDVSELVE